MILTGGGDFAAGSFFPEQAATSKAARMGNIKHFLQTVIISSSCCLQTKSKLKNGIATMPFI
jgi:hypothetical protein